MSYINKKGKTSSWRQMVIRQQLSDLLAYSRITTSITKAKETQRHADKLVTLAKENTLDSRRRALSIVLAAGGKSAEELVEKLFDKIGTHYKERNGGYTRVLKAGTRSSDRTELAILEFV